jgi:hypothetical protein
MLVDILVHLIKEHFIDVWGQQWFEGNYIIRRLWYERSHPSSKSYYILEDSPPTFMYFHMIMVSKFSMPPITHFIIGSLSTYKLSKEVLGIIHVGVAYQQLIHEHDG